MKAKTVDERLEEIAAFAIGLKEEVVGVAKWYHAAKLNEIAAQAIELEILMGEKVK